MGVVEENAPNDEKQANGPILALTSPECSVIAMTLLKYSLLASLIPSPTVIEASVILTNGDFEIVPKITPAKHDCLGTSTLDTFCSGHRYI
jgi:hypothetical protein